MKNIQIIKRSEDINRNYEDGSQTEKVSRVNYKVMSEGNEIGSVEVYPYSININLYALGENTIADNEEIVSKIFNALND